MKVTVEELPRRELALNFEAEPQDLQKYERKAWRHLAERARIPGFRPGKAPPSVLERFYGKGAVLEETLNHLIPEATEQALKERSIEAVSVPAIKVSSTEPVAWKATVALRPKVDLGNYRELRIQPEPVVVKDKEVENLLEQLRFQHTPWQPVDRPVMMGDLVTMDVLAMDGARRAADDKGAQYRPEPGSTAPMPGFAEQIVSMKTGETKEFTLTGQAQGEGAGPRQYKFTVAVREVKGKTLPPLDDEFAKGVGDGYENLAALRQHVTNQLREAAERQAREALKEKALDQLVSMAQSEFSPTLVEHEAEHLLEEQEKRLAQNQLRLDDYLKSVGKTREQILEEMKPQAEKRVLRSLVLTEFKDREGVTVAPDDVKQAIDAVLVTAEGQSVELERALNTDSSRAAVERTLVTRKTLDRLAEIVTQPAASNAASNEEKQS